MKTLFTVLAIVCLVSGNIAIIQHRKTNNPKLKYSGLALLILAWILIILRLV